MGLYVPPTVRTGDGRSIVLPTKASIAGDAGKFLAARADGQGYEHVAAGGGGGAPIPGMKKAQTTAWSQTEVGGTFTQLRGTAFTYSNGYGLGNDPTLVTGASSGFDLPAATPAGMYAYTVRFGLSIDAGTVPSSIKVEASSWWGDSWDWTFPVCPAETTVNSFGFPFVRQTVQLGPFYRPVYNPVSDGSYFGLTFKIPGVGLTFGGSKFAWYDVKRLS